MKKYNESYEIYINSTKIGRLYNKHKAIDFVQKECASLFEGHKHGEVVNTKTGEVIYNT